LFTYIYFIYLRIYIGSCTNEEMQGKINVIYQFAKQQLEKKK